MNAPLATNRYEAVPMYDRSGEEPTGEYEVRDRYRGCVVRRSGTEMDARLWIAQRRELTPYGHYRAAEELLHEVETFDDLSPQAEARLLRLAQIHATLATTGPHPMWVEGAS